MKLSPPKKKIPNVIDIMTTNVPKSGCCNKKIEIIDKTKVIGKKLSLILLFKELWKFADGDERSERFFKYFMTLWSFYGISYMFQSKIKNTGYNILDLFSKTFYGLLILYKYIRD